MQAVSRKLSQRTAVHCLWLTSPFPSQFHWESCRSQEEATKRIPRSSCTTNPVSSGAGPSARQNNLTHQGIWWPYRCSFQKSKSDFREGIARGWGVSSLEIFRSHRDVWHQLWVALQEQGLDWMDPEVPPTSAAPGDEAVFRVSFPSSSSNKNVTWPVHGELGTEQPPLFGTWGIRASHEPAPTSCTCSVAWSLLQTCDSNLPMKLSTAEVHPGEQPGKLQAKSSSFQKPHLAVCSQLR